MPRYCNTHYKTNITQHHIYYYMDYTTCLATNYRSLLLSSLLCLTLMPLAAQTSQVNAPYSKIGIGCIVANKGG